MLRLLLLRGFGPAYGRHRPYAWLGRPGSCRRTIAIANRPGGQCLSLGHRIGRDTPDEPSPSSAGSRGRAAFELIGESQYNLAQGRGFARMLGGGGKRAHRGIDLGLSVGEFIATVGFGDGLALVSGGARGRAARSGRSNWPCRRPCISSNTESLRRRAGSGHRRIAWSLEWLPPKPRRSDHPPVRWCPCCWMRRITSSNASTAPAC